MNTLGIFKIQIPPETFILCKLYNSSFYIACPGIYVESPDGMPLILTLLENELPLQELVKLLPRFQEPLFISLMAASKL